MNSCVYRTVKTVALQLSARIDVLDVLEKYCFYYLPKKAFEMLYLDRVKPFVKCDLSLRRRFNSLILHFDSTRSSSTHNIVPSFASYFVMTHTFLWLLIICIITYIDLIMTIRVCYFIAEMTICRFGANVASIGSNLFVCGGGDEASRLNTAERYDPSNNVWLPCEPMSCKRNGVGVAALNGRIYAIGKFVEQEGGLTLRH